MVDYWRVETAPANGDRRNRRHGFVDTQRFLNVFGL